MNEPLNKQQSVEELIRQCKLRGNEVEVRSSQNGVRIYEVKRKFLTEIKINPNTFPKR